MPSVLVSIRDFLVNHNKPYPSNLYRWPIVILDEDGNSLDVLDYAVDADGKQLLIKVKGQQIVEA